MEQVCIDLDKKTFLSAQAELMTLKSGYIHLPSMFPTPNLNKIIKKLKSVMI